MKHPFEVADEQIQEKKKQVDYDVREFSIEILVHKFKKKNICVPPYRPAFTWSTEKQSKFIESVILGIPMAPLLVVDVAKPGDKGGKWEIIDGVQRVHTLAQFMDNQLILNGLELLPLLNGKSIEDLSGSRRRRFAITPLKFIVFSNQSDVPMRIELFNRINSNRTEL
jgi:Protein of unknown function DUF262